MGVVNSRVRTLINGNRAGSYRTADVVGAGFAGRDLGVVLSHARTAAAEMRPPEGVTIKLAGDLRYMDDAFASLKLAIVLAVAFVYMILASQFGSFILGRWIERRFRKGAPAPEPAAKGPAVEMN